jgi:tetratricopeptide (TPR) repeat protein
MTGDQNGAIQDYTAAIRNLEGTGKVDGKLYLERGRLFDQRHQYEEAKGDFTRAISAGENSGTVYAERGQANCEIANAMRGRGYAMEYLREAEADFRTALERGDLKDYEKFKVQSNLDRVQKALEEMAKSPPPNERPPDRPPQDFNNRDPQQPPPQPQFQPRNPPQGYPPPPPQQPPSGNDPFRGPPRGPGR